MSRHKIKRRKPKRRSGPARREVRVDELQAILARSRQAALSNDEVETLSAAVETLAFLTHELEQADATVERLRKLLFGSSSEKTDDVLADVLGDTKGGEDGGSAGAQDDDSAATEDEDAKTGDDDSAATGGKETNTGDDDSAATGGKGAGADDTGKGHGRNGAAAYTGAEKVRVTHDGLAHGDPCPECGKGKVYQQKQPAVLVRVKGTAPLQATVYELERLRCNLCGEIFTARSPPGVGERKYDETAVSMIALLKYGCGLPFHRLERLGTNLGMPLPAATQWEVIAEAREAFEPLWEELIHQAAGGDIVYIDDTKARVLELGKQIKTELALGVTDRTGVFTSAVVSTLGERELVLFFTGREHAGENLQKVLKQRSAELATPIQMCDALSRNTSPGTYETLVANCMAHARRHFVDVVHSFPEEVAHVLKTLRQVYRHEAEVRKQGLSPGQRLAHHEQYSAPLMKKLETWLQEQFDQRKVEPNSTLGNAIRYLQNHWEQLTLFLRVPGAPIDNNVCERALKKAILHRRNSLFYKTAHGAHVGDIFMSLIYTAERCSVNPFDYLTAVQRQRRLVANEPARWMPWNYTQALEATQSSSPTLSD